MREIQLFEILGHKVYDSDGKYAGCIEEIEAERGDDSCAIENFLVEHRGLTDRITAWAIAYSLQHFIPVREKSKPYRVPWQLMDLSDPRNPRITVPQSELKRVRSGG
ncbi:MAG: hypothetical protein ABIQ55_09380 [Gemmatimonadaceae bacterium]